MDELDRPYLDWCRRWGRDPEATASMTEYEYDFWMHETEEYGSYDEYLRAAVLAAPPPHYI